jgi:broad specificity phosphatase PhoE
LRSLLLIKHSLPEIVENLQASEWHLSAEGCQRCAALARAVAPYVPQVILSSREPKAQETAQILADSLKRNFVVVDNLHEHERTKTPFFSKAEFQASVQRFFDQPDRLVMGDETADAAQARFGKAIQSILADRPNDNLAIVAHGTVISLFVARQTGLDGFSLWQRLGLPSFVVLSLPDLNLVKVVEKMELA